MAQIITRTITTYKATAYALAFVDGQATSRLLGSAEYVAGHESDTDARKALKAAGVPWKRGAHIEHEVVKEVKYGMPFEKFMEVADIIEDEDANEDNEY